MPLRWEPRSVVPATCIMLVSCDWCIHHLRQLVVAGAQASARYRQMDRMMAALLDVPSRSICDEVLARGARLMRLPDVTARCAARR